MKNIDTTVRAEFIESGINELQLKYEVLLEKYYLLIGVKYD